MADKPLQALWDVAPLMDEVKRTFVEDKFDAKLRLSERDNFILFAGTGSSAWTYDGWAQEPFKRTGAGIRVVIDGIALHIDPGNKASAQVDRFMRQRTGLDGILVTHAHQDAWIGLSELILSSVRGGIRKDRKPELVSNNTLINGFQDGESTHTFLPSDPYFLSMLNGRPRVMKPGDNTKIGDLVIVATPADHPENSHVDNSLGY
jgi:phosphoribosyl 1,2-cyclic phosphodiesterase